jgi:hypothetical protein
MGALQRPGQGSQSERNELEPRRLQQLEPTRYLNPYPQPVRTKLSLNHAASNRRVARPKRWPDQRPIWSDDPVHRWITAEEWKRLSPTERNQRAFERYLRSRKSAWQLGRDYERYVGYLRERAGFKVAYHAIIHGYDDLDRDVLAEKADCIEVIQCKR